jgi:hypothetical protein
VNGVRDQRANDRNWHRDLDETDRQLEVDHAAAIVADKSRQEAEGLGQ